jgi:small conductance mechanosensitive channel
MQDTQTSLIQTISDYLGPASSTLISILLILLGALVTQALLKTVLTRATIFLTKKELFRNTDERQKRIKTINSIIGAVAAIAVWSIAIMMILAKLGVAIGPIIASAGLLGAVIAFGSQSLIKDFVSGIFIIAENQYHIDDYVDIGTISGKVEAISVRTTTVRGDDGSLYFVPNGSITIISNKSVGPLRETLTVDLAADASLTIFTKKIAEISDDLSANEETKSLFIEGLSVGSVTAVTKKALSINVHYKTTAIKRKKAASTVLRKLAIASKKEQINLA